MDSAATHNQRVSSSVLQGSAETTTLRAGVALRNRYVLHNFMYNIADKAQRLKSPYDRQASALQLSQGQKWGSRDASVDSSSEAGGHDEPQIGKTYPSSDRFPDSIPEGAKVNDYAPPGGGNGSRIHLGLGSFGDVWQAYDEEKGEDVAVKIFFRNNRFLTPRLARELDIEYKLDQAIDECVTVIEIIKQKDAYPQGAQRICQCYREHISDAQEEDPVFVVMELCGAPLDAVYDEGTFQDEKPPLQARQMMKEVLQGIKLLSKLDPPVVHHDLKLENVVLGKDGHIKIIDWGSVMEYENGAEGGVCTPQYTPPEVLCGTGPSYKFVEGKSYAYDVYSIGVMYWELICNVRPFWDDDMGEPGGYVIFDGVTTHEEGRECPTGNPPEKSLGEPKDFEVIRKMMDPDPAKRMAPDEAIYHLRKLSKTGSMSKYEGGDGGNLNFYSRIDGAYCAQFSSDNCTDKCEWKDTECRLAGGHGSKGDKISPGGKKHRIARVKGTMRKKGKNGRRKRLRLARRGRGRAPGGRLVGRGSQRRGVSQRKVREMAEGDESTKGARRGSQRRKSARGSQRGKRGRGSRMSIAEPSESRRRWPEGGGGGTGGRSSMRQSTRGRQPDREHYRHDRKERSARSSRKSRKSDK